MYHGSDFDVVLFLLICGSRGTWCSPMETGGVTHFLGRCCLHVTMHVVVHQLHSGIKLSPPDTRGCDFAWVSIA